MLAPGTTGGPITVSNDVKDAKIAKLWKELKLFFNSQHMSADICPVATALTDQPDDRSPRGSVPGNSR